MHCLLSLNIHIGFHLVQINYISNCIDHHQRNDFKNSLITIRYVIEFKHIT